MLQIIYIIRYWKSERYKDELCQSDQEIQLIYVYKIMKS